MCALCSCRCDYIDENKHLFLAPVYRIGTGRIKLTWCFSFPQESEEEPISEKMSHLVPDKQGEGNGPLGACSLKSHQPVTTDVNNSNVLSLSGLESA